MCCSSDLAGERRQRSSDVNQALFQPFANYNLGSGLSAGVSMEASAKWEAHETWTAPLMFNVSKVTLLGKRPASFAVAAGPTLASADDSASWRFRLSVTFCSRGSRAA